MQGFILYRGPSVLDGEPIVAIVTGLEIESDNEKTGSMAQIYILREDVHPVKAIHTGDDASVCGNCPHRGRLEVSDKTGLRRNVGRSCYVNLVYGPRMVWESYRNGNYQTLTPAKAARVLMHHKVRLGAYGDPAAVPFRVWKTALQHVVDRTGYTHQWRRFPALAAYCMASVDTPEEKEEAEAMGFRTFRVRAEGDPLMPDEISCPASKEAGKRTTCAACMLCKGKLPAATSGRVPKNITIITHGSRRLNYNRWRGKEIDKKKSHRIRSKELTLESHDG